MPGILCHISYASVVANVCVQNWLPNCDRLFEQFCEFSRADINPVESDLSSAIIFSRHDNGVSTIWTPQATSRHRAHNIQDHMAWYLADFGNTIFGWSCAPDLVGSLLPIMWCTNEIKVLTC